MAALRRRRALIIIDVQNDFVEGGSLAVPCGESVVPHVNALRSLTTWTAVFVSQDWHPASHASFAANHPGAEVFSVRELPLVGKQVMWPVHCVQGTHGAAFHPDLVVESTDVVIRKGTLPDIDSYSAFGDALGHQHERTELEGALRGRGITDVWLCGLATDYCVSFTAKDAAKAGFKTTVVLPACAGISGDSTERELAAIKQLGMRIVTSMEEAQALLRDE